MACCNEHHHFCPDFFLSSDMQFIFEQELSPFLRIQGIQRAQYNVLILRLWSVEETPFPPPPLSLPVQANLIDYVGIDPARNSSEVQYLFAHVKPEPTQSDKGTDRLMQTRKTQNNVFLNETKNCMLVIVKNPLICIVIIGRGHSIKVLWPLFRRRWLWRTSPAQSWWRSKRRPTETGPWASGGLLSFSEKFLYFFHLLPFPYISHEFFRCVPAGKK